MQSASLQDYLLKNFPGISIVGKPTKNKNTESIQFTGMVNETHLSSTLISYLKESKKCSHHHPPNHNENVITIVGMPHDNRAHYTVKFTSGEVHKLHLSTISLRN